MAYITNPYEGYAYSDQNPQRIKLETVESYTPKDFGLTPNHVKAMHHGITIKDKNNRELPDEYYKMAIESSIAQVEHDFDIAILPRLIDEHLDFHRAEYEQYMFLNTKRKPLLQLESLRMQYGGQQIYNYPPEWWKVYTREGQIQVMPQLLLSTQGTSMNQLVHSSYPMVAGLPQQAKHRNNAPQLFNVRYVAGMLPPEREGVYYDWEMPPTVNMLILKMALIEAMEQFGRLIIGPGIGSMSNSLDGASQTIDTTQTAMYGGASAEIVQLNEDIAKLKKSLTAYFGINIGVAGG